MIIDWSYIDDASNGNPVLRLELLRLLRVQVVSAPDELSRLVSSSDYEALSALAHKYKSTARTIANTPLIEALLQIENNCKKIISLRQIAQNTAFAKSFIISPLTENETTDNEKQCLSNIQDQIKICKLQCKSVAQQVDAEIDRISPDVEP